ncbi:MAG: amino acid permease [Deltaproteobacteria bacterium]|nr:amino acid permease [Deltaproteobacteria bacterium]
MSLAPKLGLMNALMLVVGSVVGAGIFTTSGFLAAELPQGAAFVLVWIVGGALTLAGALTYAEMGGMFPRAGGDYQFLKEAYGPWAGFVLGWLAFLVVNPGSIAALAIALAGYAGDVVPLGGAWGKTAFALGTIAVLSAINVRGVKWAGAAQDVMTIASIALIAGLVALGLASGKGDLSHFATSDAPFSFRAFTGPAMIAVIFTYSGWFASAYVASEVKRPERNVPLSMFLGTLVVTVLYVALNVFYLYALPLSAMKGEPNVAARASALLLGPHVSLAVTVTILLAIATCVNGTILTGARVTYAMAEDGVFWPLFKRVHPRFRTPHLGIWAQGALSMLLVLLGTFEQILSYVVFVMLLTSAAAGVALVVLRVRRPGAPRPYRTFGYPVTPFVFVVSYAWIAALVLLDKPAPSALGLVIAASGVPVYLYWSRKKHAKSSKEMLP